MLLSGRCAEILVIVKNYCESMYFSAVIVDDCNNHGVPHSVGQAAHHYGRIMLHDLAPRSFSGPHRIPGDFV